LDERLVMVTHAPFVHDSSLLGCDFEMKNRPESLFN